MKYIVLLLSMVFYIPASAQVVKECSAPSEKAALYNEAQLKVEFENFIDSLDAMKIAVEYPEAIKLLLSSRPEKKIQGIHMLESSNQIEVLPWLVPLTEADEQALGISALFAIKELVVNHTLRRRDMSRPEGIFIKPLEQGQVDFRPLAWMVLQHLRLGDAAPNRVSYVATMAGYLNLGMFQVELEKLLQSRHPAVVNSAKHALQLIREGHC